MKTNVHNVLQMQHFSWKNKVSQKSISSLTDWILGQERWNLV